MGLICGSCDRSGMPAIEGERGLTRPAKLPEPCAPRPRAREPGSAGCPGPPSAASVRPPTTRPPRVGSPAHHAASHWPARDGERGGSTQGFRGPRSRCRQGCAPDQPSGHAGDARGSAGVPYATDHAGRPLVATGSGDVPLIHLRFRCSNCGSTCAHSRADLSWVRKSSAAHCDRSFLALIASSRAFSSEGT
jgi:hypothetical protein